MDYRGSSLFCWVSSFDAFLTLCVSQHSVFYEVFLINCVSINHNLYISTEQNSQNYSICIVQCALCNTFHIITCISAMFVFHLVGRVDGSYQLRRINSFEITSNMQFQRSAIHYFYYCSSWHSNDKLIG